MKRSLIVVLACLCCLAATKSGQTQNAEPRGPIRLEGARPTHGPVSIYTLRFLQIAETKPIEHLWILQKQDTVTRNGPIEPNETAFRSLNSPVLRDFVSHLPEGARIVYSSVTLPRPGPTNKVDGGSEPDLQGFVTFCRSRKVDFWFGVLF